MTHPSNRIDDVVHQRVRLGILATLAPADEIEFTFLRDALGVSDGNLSRHLNVLEETKLVRIRKSFQGRKPRTTASITAAGRRALDDEVRALNEILGPLTRP